VDETFLSRNFPPQSKGHSLPYYHRKNWKAFDRAMTQSDAYRMITRRPRGAGIVTKVRNHAFRATGITEYWRNGSRRGIAQQMANHESARTTGLYDRRDDEVSLDEVERIVI
jgi:integrase